MSTLADFTERLRAASAEAPAGTKSLKIDLLGAGVIWMHGPEVDNEDRPADCTVYVTQSDLEAIATGELDPTAAFMAGKLRIDGDVGVAMALQSVLGRAFG